MHDHFSALYIWVAASLEVCGVFLLSVEAIKLQNLHKLNERLRSYYRFVNPEVQFVDSDEEVEASPPHPLYGFTVSLWAIFLVVFVATPLVLVLTPAITVLSKIEKHTETGAIGIIGFIFWLTSFIINHIIYK